MKTERMTFVGRRVRAKAQRRESAMRASGPATRPVWSGLRAHKASNRTAKLGWGRPGGFWIEFAPRPEGNGTAQGCDRGSVPCLAAAVYTQRPRWPAQHGGGRDRPGAHPRDTSLRVRKEEAKRWEMEWWARAFIYVTRLQRTKDF